MVGVFRKHITILLPAVTALVSACSTSPVTPSSVLTVAGTSNLTALQQTSQLSATETPSVGSPTNVTTQATWTSSNTAIATVSSSGLVTAVAAGSVTITATSSGLTGSLTMTITAQVTTASGPETYTYVGNPFTVFGHGYACPPICSITGSFTLASSLVANLGFSAVGVKSFAFTDGSTTITQANASFTQFFVSTDVNGHISQPWQIELQTLTPSGAILLATINPQTQGGAGDSSSIATGSGGSAFNVQTPGFWSQQP